jgi:hypothetical protein
VVEIYPGFAKNKPSPEHEVLDAETLGSHNQIIYQVDLSKYRYSIDYWFNV